MNQSRLSGPQRKEFILQVGNKKIPLLNKLTIIGRNPGATIFIDDVSLAKEHANIQLNDQFDQPVLIDKGSVNGCTVNGKKLSKNSEQKLKNNDTIKFGNHQHLTYAQIDHLTGQPFPQPSDQLRQSKNPFEYNYVPAYAASLEEFETPSPRKSNQNMMNTMQSMNNNHNQHNFNNQKNQNNQNNSQFNPNQQQNQSIEERLRQSEGNIQALIEKERKLLEEKVAQSMLREDDIDRLQTNNMKQVQQLEQQSNSIRNKNEKLQRVLVEKEATILELQTQNAKLTNELKNTIQTKDLNEAKLKALEQYTTDLQIKYDQSQNSNSEKAQALNELIQNDLPARLVEYKRHIQELRMTLDSKEREKEQFLQNFELGSSEYYSKSLLEKQASDLINLQRTIEEYERRQQLCEKKWADLLKENQLNLEQSQTCKEQLEKQRESYNRLLTMTERRVIQANNAVALAYSEQGDEEKRVAAEFLSNQIYQLYEERRQLLSEKDQFIIQNNELQRLNVALRVELEKYKTYIAEDFSGHTGQLICRVEELQDLLIQQKQMTDVSIIVDSHAQIRALNVELAKKTKLIDDLKSKVQHFNSKRNAKDLKQDEDVVEYLVNIVKEREKAIEELQFRITQMVVRFNLHFIFQQQREQDFKEKIERYEFILDEGDSQNPIYQQKRNDCKKPFGIKQVNWEFEYKRTKREI
ncbi:fha domain containing protein [Stylonychia lemnae]|uniref:Fha domain containing protein n=1 Tax=Stylonychia lemnae TaxID=5949 RepID=A0A078A523_STYLE|nr:fha domain containing protein [Stylonychia lemnae]|eukprot:CDW76964.1 fha domain containing protein [Stylonychia lemnae]